MLVNQTWWNQKKNSTKTFLKKSYRCVDNESEDDVLIFAAALRMWAVEIKGWNGSERKQCVPFCPIRCTFNFIPSTPLLQPIYPSQAPSSLLEALEQHLASLEGRKLKDLSTTSRYGDITKKQHSHLIQQLLLQLPVLLIHYWYYFYSKAITTLADLWVLPHNESIIMLIFYIVLDCFY